MCDECYTNGMSCGRTGKGATGWLSPGKTGKPPTGGGLGVRTWRMDGILPGRGNSMWELWQQERVWHNRKQGYFWMFGAENPCRVWARGVEAERWVKGLVWHGEDILGMPARVGDRGTFSHCCSVRSRHTLYGEQIGTIYQKYKCISPLTQEWHI